MEAGTEGAGGEGNGMPSCVMGLDDDEAEVDGCELLAGAFRRVLFPWGARYNCMEGEEGAGRGP